MIVRRANDRAQNGACSLRVYANFRQRVALIDRHLRQITFSLAFSKDARNDPRGDALETALRGFEGVRQVMHAGNGLNATRNRLPHDRASLSTLSSGVATFSYSRKGRLATSYSRLVDK